MFFPDSVWNGRFYFIEELFFMRHLPLFSMGILLNEIRCNRGNKWLLSTGILNQRNCLSHHRFARAQPGRDGAIVRYVGLWRIPDDPDTAIQAVDLHQHDFLFAVSVPQQPGLCGDGPVGIIWLLATHSGCPGNSVFHWSCFRYYLLFRNAINGLLEKKLETV